MKITITIWDTENGLAQCDAEFDPPLNHMELKDEEGNEIVPITPALAAAMTMFRAAIPQPELKMEEPEEPELPNVDGPHPETALTADDKPEDNGHPVDELEMAAQVAERIESMPNRELPMAVKTPVAATEIESMPEERINGHATGDGKVS